MAGATVLANSALALGVAHLLAAGAASADAQRRRDAAIGALKVRNPGQWRFLDREGGRYALRKWSEKDPDQVDDDVLRAMLERAARSKRWTDRLLLPGAVLVGIVALVRGLGQA